MLVLSRKVGESIIIADEVTITVLECKGNYTRVGITAPREISVQREEIQIRMIKEREEAAANTDSVEAGPDDDTENTLLAKPATKIS